MELNIVCAELERLYELDELKQLSATLLGWDPARVGGVTAKSSFVRALTQRCAEMDALEALLDAVVATHADVDPRVVQLRSRGFVPVEELAPGDAVGPYFIMKKIGSGRLGVTYRARSSEADVRLRLLFRETAREARGVQRYFTHTRLVGTVAHPGLPTTVTAGEIAEGRLGVVHDFIEGATLAERVGARGTSFRELRPVLLQILEVLAELHQRRLAHGALHAGNVLITDGPTGPSVSLLDAGSNLVRVRASLTNGHDHRLSTIGSPYTVAPEQIQGALPDPKSDVYAFGAMVFQLIAGRPVFGGGSPLRSLVGHLELEPPHLTSIAARGSASPDVDEWLLELLSKDPSKRPESAADLITQVKALGRKSMAGYTMISDEELVQRLQALAANPADDAEAAALEASADAGANPQHLAEGFQWIADQLAPDQAALRRQMLLRAGRLYEAAELPENAEVLYAQLLEADLNDVEAEAALDRVKRQLGKHEELIETLLEQSEEASGPVRASLLARIAKLYRDELQDTEQALFAYTQALCEEPDDDAVASEIERIAGSKQPAWEEVLSTCTEAAGADPGSPGSQMLYLRIGRWYLDKIARPDLALNCFGAVLNHEPSNDEALAGMAAVYRKTQAWAELGQALIRRAELAPPALGRELRAEAGELLEEKLGNAAAARELYEAVLAEDAGHERAGEALGRMVEQAGDFGRLARLLEQRADASGGALRVRLFCRAAEVHEDKLDDGDAAARCYAQALADEPTNPAALRGLDRAYAKTGKFTELLEVLQKQLEQAQTARQKVVVLERIAAVNEEEFLNFAAAAQACELSLDLDPENDAALTSLARCYRMLERWSDVALVYERHLQLLEDRDRRQEKTLALARVLHQNLNAGDRAAAAYEEVLKLNPGHFESLEALALLRGKSGDTAAALDAFDALAEGAETPEARAEHYQRAAKFLEKAGNLDAAVQRYKLALDADPNNRQIWRALRDAQVARGDHAGAVELLERELGQTEGESARGRISGDIARICYEHLKDFGRAEVTARRALGLDPGNVDALTVLGHVAFSEGNFLEASTYYEQVVRHAELFEREDALRVLTSYIDALTKVGAAEKALGICDGMVRIAQDDPTALQKAAEIVFLHGEPQKAFGLYRDLIQRFEDQLSDDELGLAHYRLGESARKSGDLELARQQLERSLELNPNAPETYAALARLHEARQDWQAAIRILHHELGLVDAEQRVEILLQIGDLAGGKLNDHGYAGQNYLAALSERPNDRKVLNKLMQLYSSAKDWPRLLDIVLRLSDLVDEPQQRAKYLHTAGKLAAKELGDVRRGVELLTHAVELDPKNSAALNEAIELHRRAGDHEGVKELLKQRITIASEAGDRPTLLASLHQLFDTYLHHLNKPDQAVAVLESAQELDPTPQRAATLRKLYLSDPERHLDKAAAELAKELKNSPFSPEPYQQLRRIYTEVRQPDAAWCACQALSVLGRATPDELKFYERMRSEEAAPVQSVLDEGDLIELIMPPETDTVLTSVFALIAPAVVAAHGKPLEAFGLTPEHRLEFETYPYGSVYSLHYAAQALGVAEPPFFQDPSNDGGLEFLHTVVPSVLIGQAALESQLSAQASA
ncbi:MAG TPA: tetratricopeptide repeat protein, partial [Polyangiaceae bacterium]|nr:tetratricopeptide repeat protein [Polyangiaceae bacterium]